MAADQTSSALSGLAEQLKAARAGKGLSQRALGQKVGVPQSHISKIESGQVDIKTSSLIELARALGLEPMLVPRRLMPAVEALSRGQDSATQTKSMPPQRFYGGGDAVTPAPIEAAHRALAAAEKDAERLERAIGPAPEIQRLSEAVRDVRRWPLNIGVAEQVREALKPIQLLRDTLKEALKLQLNTREMLKKPEIAAALREVARAADSLRSIRNALAHGAGPASMPRLPAYRLSDNGGDGDDHE
ncbi:MAG: helix-turn-helix transcriptional regulator [Hyphomonadaceae bacterium]|nr:helix-turn-helix transcriptional regulator [Hyphomonadaceae bacterium]